MEQGVPDSVEARMRSILEASGVSGNVRLAQQLVSEAVGLASDDPDTLDLKIATAALTEMREAYRVFAPFKDAKKVSIFGSARTKPDDLLYAQARDLAAALAEVGWMTVTGAGPGIMQAGMEGAGRDRSIGVSIRLPFESGANSIIAGDDKHVAMKYFFTRKLMLVKESQAFVCLPGGFGTLDETFELLTLIQTGKSLPVPVVLLDAPDDPFWEQVDHLVREQLVRRGLVSPNDTGLYTITDSAEVACDTIEHFYANYHSIRFVGDLLVIRMHQAPDDAQIAELNERYAHLLASGTIRRIDTTRAEQRDDDFVDLARIAFDFTKHGYGDIIAMIGDLNRFASSAP